MNKNLKRGQQLTERWATKKGFLFSTLNFVAVGLHYNASWRVGKENQNKVERERVRELIDGDRKRERECVCGERVGMGF